MSTIETLKTARDVLFRAAEDYVMKGKHDESQRALCNAASDYAKERQAVYRPPKPGADAAHRSGFRVPFGRNKGEAIEECDTKDLIWLMNAMKERLDEPNAQRFRAQNEKLISAIEAEVGTR